MPRHNAVGKWDMKVDPNVYYMKEDPFNVLHSTEEWKKAYLINGLVERERVVDIGCGEGHFTNLYKTNRNFAIGLDISGIAIGRAIEKYKKDSLEFHVFDITRNIWNMPFATYILSEVLYYIEPCYWGNVVENLSNSIDKLDQLIISVGQYFTEEDIEKMFKGKFIFDKVYKLPNKKYGYWLIMSGHRV